jgi:AbrB family looped-hinge helix DNA binding protein
LGAEAASDPRSVCVIEGRELGRDEASGFVNLLGAGGRVLMDEQTSLRWRVLRLPARNHANAIRAFRAIRLPGLLHWETSGSVMSMKTSIDSVGRIVVPKALRDALGLTAGSTVDISRYGAGLQLIPTGRTAQLVEESGVLVATGETTVDDDVIFGLLDSGRR